MPQNLGPSSNIGGLGGGLSGLGLGLALGPGRYINSEGFEKNALIFSLSLFKFPFTFYFLMIDRHPFNIYIYIYIKLEKVNGHKFYGQNWELTLFTKQNN